MEANTHWVLSVRVNQCPLLWRSVLTAPTTHNGGHYSLGTHGVLIGYSQLTVGRVHSSPDAHGTHPRESAGRSGSALKVETSTTVGFSHRQSGVRIFDASVTFLIRGIHFFHDAQ